MMDNHPEDILLLNKLNERFHSTLYAPSGRRHLCEMIDMLRRRSQHYYHAYMVDLGGMTESQTEHWAILEACRKGEATKAAIMMRHHVREFGVPWLSTFSGERLQPLKQNFRNTR